MSRIGRLPVVVSDKVQVSISPENVVMIKGAKGTISVKMKPQVKAKVEGKEIILSRTDETKSTKALHGLYRALVQNAVTGVTTGFSKTLELNGVGYRAAVAGKKLELSLGFSHQVHFPIPEGISIAVDKQTQITISGASREKVGQTAAQIRAYRPPEPYLGKGIKYLNEVIRRKAGKSAGK